ncbi:hypothetical protein T12_15311 [Trichinella patagoniensis]|uniref:Uncharacterized protein n=1 Tax=Trichinella patagoniensis TaxID=990121 RepID=A0A0V0YQR7_9BILA|nr:hypothetical protein T12_15311 [Trichinella patagoniensis]
MLLIVFLLLMSSVSPIAMFVVQTLSAMKYWILKMDYNV